MDQFRSFPVKKRKMSYICLERGSEVKRKFEEKWELFLTLLFTYGKNSIEEERFNVHKREEDRMIGSG